MSKLKRFNCGNGDGMFNDKSGNWVPYEDVEPLQESHDRLVEVVDGLLNDLHEHFGYTEQREDQILEALHKAKELTKKP